MPLPFVGGDELTLIEDTRNQIGKHRNIEYYCQRNGIELIRKKLDVGDYAFPDGKIAVDTKQDLLELSKNIMSSDHRRFRAECELAKELGIHLVFLVEEVPPFGKVDLWQVPRWRTSNQFHRCGDRMTLVDPKTLRKAMITMVIKYGIEFQFCTRRQSPSRVIKILKGESK